MQLKRRFGARTKLDLQIQKPFVHCLFWGGSNTSCFIVADETTGKCAVIDSCTDLDTVSGVVSYEHAQSVTEYIKEKGWSNQWILETHIHADHITGASFLKKSIGGKSAMSKKITQVQKHFAPLFNLKGFPTDGSQFDHLFDDNEQFKLGNIPCQVIPTPGHTPDSVSYLIGDALFTGDTAFMPDFGTARCDFPNGSAEQLYDSIKRLYELPDNTRWFVGHDYPPGGRQVAMETSVAQQKASNIHLNEKTTKDEFVSMRTKKDHTLALPRLLYPSILANINAGNFIPADNGTCYLMTPITIKQK